MALTSDFLISPVTTVYNNSLITRLEEPRTLTQADREAGVFEDVKVRLGNDEDGPQGRLVRVEKDGHTFLLFTNLEDIEAELVSLIYRCRWQIELFFKWIKCVLGCRHWLAESQAGVTIQVYCALIASVLLVLWTGSRPTKRQWETLQLYGWGGSLSRNFKPGFSLEKNPQPTAHPFSVSLVGTGSACLHPSNLHSRSCSALAFLALTTLVAFFFTPSIFPAEHY